MRHLPTPVMLQAYGEARRTRVYVAGPLYSSGEVDNNVARACDVGTLLWRAGYQPFVPHLNVHWAARARHITESEWLAWDLGWLDQCAALVRLPGKSTGSDIEVAHARYRNIYVVELPANRTLPEAVAEVALPRLDGYFGAGNR